MFHLISVAAASAPASAAGGELLANGGFGDGLRGWSQACTSPSCGVAKPHANAARSGSSGLSLSCTADSWTSLALRQPLPNPLPSGQLSLQAWVRAAHGEQPAVRLGVTLEFEDASGSRLEGCSRTRDEMPSASEWSLLATQCPVPASAARGWAALEWASLQTYLSAGAAAHADGDLDVGDASSRRDMERARRRERIVVDYLASSRCVGRPQHVELLL